MPQSPAAKAASVRIEEHESCQGAAGRAAGEYHAAQAFDRMALVWAFSR